MIYCLQYTKKNTVALDHHGERNERRDSSTQPLASGGEDGVVGTTVYPRELHDGSLFSSFTD